MPAPPFLIIGAASAGTTSLPLFRGLDRLLGGKNPTGQRLLGLLPRSVGAPLARSIRRFFRYRPSLPPAFRRELVAAYRDDIGKLETLIGRDLSAWLR